MDNFGSNKPTGNEQPEKPIPLGGADSARTTVSRSPLNLGGGTGPQAPKVEAAKKPAPAPKPPAPPAKPDTPAPSATAGRVTGVKTFFTKLHPGALEFLDEQITKWLKENPTISIKLTNTTTGMVQAKKSEPNIIISVWH